MKKTRFITCYLCGETTTNHDMKGWFTYDGEPVTVCSDCYWFEFEKYFRRATKQWEY